MTDHAWSQGMGLLIALGLPGWPEDEKTSSLRSQAMRPLLDDLTDEQWLHACTTAANRERWFPVVATLREYAEGYVPQYPMLPPARDEVTREQDREVARRGVQLIREVLKQQTGTDPGEPVGSL